MVIVTTPPALAAVLLIVAGGWLWQTSGPLSLLLAVLFGVGLLVSWQRRWPAAFSRWLRLRVSPLAWWGFGVR